MSLLHSIVHRGVEDLKKVQESIHGRPKLEAALHFLEAMSSHDTNTLEAVFDETLSYNVLPASLKNPPFGKSAVSAVCSKVGAGVKNFKMIPVSPPFEAEGDRVILHARIDPTAHASTPGGVPYDNEYLYILSFVNRDGKWLIGNLIEYMDSQAITSWLKALADERAAASGGAPPPAAPAGGFTST